MSDHRTERSVNRTEISDSEPKVIFMSAVAEAAQLLREISEPWSPGESFKAAINRVTASVNRVGVARKLISEPLRVSRVEDLWRQEARRVDAEEMDAIRAARSLIKAAQNEKNLGDAREEYRAETARAEALETAIRLLSTNEGRAALAELIEAGRGLDRALVR